MKQVLIMLVVTVFTYASTTAQTTCKTDGTNVKKVVKHTSAAHKTKGTTTKTTTTEALACRMIAYKVCTILPDRRSVSCYETIDTNELTQTGPTTYYGPTGPMPGEVVKFKVRTIVIKGEDKGSYCKRNKENNATICYSPGIIIRDQNGYYSYGEAMPEKTTVIVTKE